jgi:hypothetical protein
MVERIYGGQKDTLPGIFKHWGGQRSFLLEIIPEDHNLAIAIHYLHAGMNQFICTAIGLY